MSEHYDFDFRDIVEEAQDIILVTKAFPLDDPGPEIVYVNKAFTALTGYRAEEVLGKNPRLLQADDTDKQTTNEIRAALEQQLPVNTIIKNYHKNGRAYWLDMNIIPLKNRAGEVTHFAAVERDVTAMVEKEMRLKEESTTDPLSGLLNRRAFEKIINLNFAKAVSQGSSFCVLMIDLDHFKSINDRYGHEVGDRALQVTSAICRRVFREQDPVCRYGGEEFCVLLSELPMPVALQVAQRFIVELARTDIDTEQGVVQLTASVGVSEFNPGDGSAIDLLRRADKALYQAKHEGRNRVCLASLAN